MKGQNKFSFEVHVESLDGANLSGNERIVFDILAKNSPMNLSDIKSRSGLNGKQWDIAIRALCQGGMTRVIRIDDGLTVESDYGMTLSDIQ